MEIVSIINQKGGVAKTTTALNLAYGLYTRNKAKVLLLDLDSQENLTFTMGATDTDYSILDLMINNKLNIKDAITNIKGIDFIRADKQLSNIEMVLKQTGKEYKLKEILEPIKKNYDYIIIDTPPALNILTVNSLVASSQALIASQADYYSLQGINDINENIQSIIKYCNKDLKLIGILLTRYNERTNLTKQLTDLMQSLASKLKTKVFKTKIRESIIIKESQAVGQSIYEYAKNSNVAMDYMDFIKEYIKGGK